MENPNKSSKRSGRIKPKGKPALKIKKFWFQILLFVIIILAIIFLSIKPNFNNGSEKKVNSRPINDFRKEGILSFYKKGNQKEILTIDIELADNEHERARGLMYRYKMSDRAGMLFLMDREEPQSFWMRNTYIPLDIIFMNKEFRIVKIQKYTRPLTDDPIPSIENSIYVLEVVEGFCDMHGIMEGDSIHYVKAK